MDTTETTSSDFYEKLEETSQNRVAERSSASHPSGGTYLIHDASNFYDLLECAPDASPQELRAAYLRAKSAYKKDSVALYSLISEEETEGLLARIEEAYQILSNPERRRDYDRNHGLLSTEDEMLESPVTHAKRHQKIVSIDRVPPMEDTRSEGDILIPPATDFTGESRSQAAATARAEESPLEILSAGPVPMPSASTPPVSRPAARPPAPMGMPAAPVPSAPVRPNTDEGGRQLAEEIAHEIAQETEWRGTFIRKLREAKSVSIEELSDYTKISKTYLFAVEDEAFDKLPAAVYLRGFVTQIARYLKLPHEKMTAAYMARHATYLKEKDGKR